MIKSLINQKRKSENMKQTQSSDNRRKTEKLSLINELKNEIKYTMSYIAASIWTDNRPIEYKLYITNNKDVFVVVSDQIHQDSYLTLTTDAQGDSQLVPTACAHKITKRNHMILSYEKNKQWLQDIIDNTLTDKEIYKIIDNYNHNIRLIVEGYSNLFAMPVFEAIELFESTHEENNMPTVQNETIAEITSNLTTEIISEFADKFEKNNFDKVWQKITEI